MLNWFKKHRDTFRKEGGMQEKIDSINRKNEVADKILNGPMKELHLRENRMMQVPIYFKDRRSHVPQERTA